MQVIIGVDPHKASHTAVAIDTSEAQLDHKKVRAARTQVDHLLAWAEPFPARTWAIEGADGMGYLLAQQLVAAGEHVVNVPATLASRTRLLGTGRTNKNDPNDALSVAITALRTPRPAPGPAGRPQRGAAAAGQAQQRHRRPTDPARLPDARACCSSSIRAGSPRRSTLLTSTGSSPRSPGHAGRAGPLRPGRRAPRRHPPPRRTAQGIAQADPHRGRRVGDHASPTSSASGRSSPRCSSASPATSAGSRTATATPPTTAPPLSSSPRAAAPSTGSPTRGNRNLNHALHIAAICQLRQPHSEGRAYFDRRVAEGKTKKEALRRSSARSATPSTGTSSPTPPAPRLTAGPGGQAGTTRSQRDRSYIPDDRLFGKVTPGPTPTLRPRHHAVSSTRPNTRSKRPS